MARKVGRHFLGTEKEPPPAHPKAGGRRPVIHSHSARVKRGLKTGGHK